MDKNFSKAIEHLKVLFSGMEREYFISREDDGLIFDVPWVVIVTFDNNEVAVSFYSNCHPNMASEITQSICNAGVKFTIYESQFPVFDKKGKQIGMVFGEEADIAFENYWASKLVKHARRNN